MLSPAALLLDPETMDAAQERATEIYKQAAQLAFQLWTQRTAVRCAHLNELKSQELVFDIKNNRLQPHSLVRHEDYEDHLKGRLVEVMVYPLVEVCGTVDDEHYDQGRVWMPAEV